MAKAKIGEIKKLVCVGDGMVAAVGTKGTYRFFWLPAVSRARVDEIDDNRLNMALRWAYCDSTELAGIMPRGAVIPLPSEKRAANWLKQKRGPKKGSTWFFDSAVEAGFRPRFYLREKENPYKSGTKSYTFWRLECAYIEQWTYVVEGCKNCFDKVDKVTQKFLGKIPDWQTKMLIMSFLAEPYAPVELQYYKSYIETTPLL